MERGEEPFAVGIALIFFAAVVFAIGAGSVIGRAPSALVNDQRREWMALRSGG
jgi:hypothetical protein